MRYQELNDYELISYVYENDEDARNILLKKYEPLIASIVLRMMKSCPYTGLDRSDLMQEGLIGLDHAMDYFNDRKDITFYTYAKTCIERKIISAIIAAKRLKHKPLNDAVPIENDNDASVPDKFLRDDSGNPEEILLDEAKTEFLKKEIRESLTDFELQVFELMISSFNYREIAEVLDKDRKQIDNAIQRIKIKVKEKLKEIEEV